jgi:hypothetical protein
MNAAPPISRPAALAVELPRATIAPVVDHHMLPPIYLGFGWLLCASLSFCSSCSNNSCVSVCLL